MNAGHAAWAGHGRAAGQNPGHPQPAPPRPGILRAAVPEAQPRPAAHQSSRPWPATAKPGTTGRAHDQQAAEDGRLTPFCESALTCTETHTAAVRYVVMRRAHDHRCRAERGHPARPLGDSVHGDRHVVHARRRLERKVIQAERREDPPPLFADLDCAVRGPDPFLRVCLGSSVISESTPSREHAPRTKVPADRTFGPEAQRHGGTRPPLRGVTVRPGVARAVCRAARPGIGFAGTLFRGPGNCRVAGP